VELQWVNRMSLALDGQKREGDRKVAVSRAQGLVQRRAREVLASLVDDESGADKPALEPTSCRPNHAAWSNRSRNPESVSLQWKEEDRTHGHRHWDMLSLSLASTDKARAVKRPLEVIEPRLLPD